MHIYCRSSFLPLSPTHPLAYTPGTEDFTAMAATATVAVMATAWVME